jgi:Heparinase II/III-like protein/Heparinase II/III N-terminus
MSLVKKLTWYRHRLSAMSLAEVKYRLVAKWRVWTHGSFLKSLQSFTSLEVNPKALRLPEPAEFPEAYRQELATDAKRLLKGEWQLFGWKSVEVGAPPCWHRDPAFGTVIDPDLPAHRLNHRDLPSGADARTIWEINRWAEMTRLGMHGWLNADADAIRTAQLWIEDWCDRNPPGVGINWTSPLEVALRLLNFTWFDALVCQLNDSALQAAQMDLVKRVVPIHAAWIWRYRSSGSSANNHLLGELAALVVANSRWPALEKISCTTDKAWQALGNEVLRQYADDGGSKEQALHYHLFGFDLAWQAARVMGCKAGPVYDRLSQAAHFFAELCQKDESWDYGDSDDAQVVPVTHRRSHAIQEWQAWMQGEKAVIDLWLGPPPLAQKPLANHDWRTFPTTGLAALRSHGWFARLDASPLGFGSIAAHGHCDALHLSIWDADIALLIDPGTGSYYGNVELRDELAQWNAHNGPLPDETSYETPRRHGPFLQLDHHTQPTLVTEGTAAIARFEHEGHSFQRHVLWHGEAIEIRDTEDAQRPFCIHWCLAPECVIEENLSLKPGRFIIHRNDRHWELFMDAPGATFSTTTRRVSSAYGRIDEATVIIVKGVQTGIATRLRRLAE